MDTLKRARRVGVPIVTYATSDPAASIHAIANVLNDCVMIAWDIAGGLTAPPTQHSVEATDVIKNIAAVMGADEPSECRNLPAVIGAMEQMPTATVLVVHNAQWALREPHVVQAVWNVRDSNKSTGKMLILMGPTVPTPIELRDDVIEIDEPLPSTEELQQVVTATAASAELTLDNEAIEKAAEACTGLSAFSAEQLTAMALHRGGVNVEQIWAGKYAKINETPGLQVITGGSYSAIAGCEGIKRFLAGIMQGHDSPNCVVFVDEMEKALGGSSTDTSGVSQDQMGQLLEWMQDTDANGLIMTGAPGTTKSEIAKAAGGQHGVPTIKIDLGGMKASLVGESQQRVRAALKVIHAISGGKTLWLATCNSLMNMPPELRRRFQFGTWFNDLPTREERDAIWRLYVTKYAITESYEPFLDEPLTGAEIRTACKVAWRMQTGLAEATGYLVPVAKSAAATIETLRQAANRTMISSATGRLYEINQPKAEPNQKRKLVLEQGN